MSKITFSKLNLTKNTEVKTVKINDQIIEVKQYLPVEEKLKFATDVLNMIQDGNNFINEIKLRAYTDLYLVFYYTNISFTEKQKEDLAKLYDLLESNGVISKICGAIPQEEGAKLYSGIRSIAENIYQYRNSAYGILDSLKTDYDNLNLDMTQLQEAIQDPENLSLVKGILSKLG